MPEYFWYDPWTGELAGFALKEGVYEPIDVDEHGRLPCRVLSLTLVRWTGAYRDVEATWLRWATSDGALLPIAEEQAEHARRRVADLEARLAQLEAGGRPDD